MLIVIGFQYSFVLFLLINWKECPVPVIRLTDFLLFRYPKGVFLDKKIEAGFPIAGLTPQCSMTSKSNSLANEMVLR